MHIGLHLWVYVWVEAAISIVCVAATIGERAPITKKLPSSTTVSLPLHLQNVLSSWKAYIGVFLFCNLYMSKFKHWCSDAVGVCQIWLEFKSESSLCYFNAIKFMFYRHSAVTHNGEINSLLVVSHNQKKNQE